MLKHFYCPTKLEVNTQIKPEEALSKRLSRVLRLKAGDKVALFNNSGLFEVELLDDKAKALQVHQQLQEPKRPEQVTLLICMPKKDAMDRILRQATEMGVKAIQPLLSDYTVKDKFKPERAELIVVEAAEQCERLSVPEILPAKQLKEALSDYKQICWCAERTDSKFGDPKLGEESALLVGPEGGFSDAEKELLNNQPHVTPVGLGKFVLRADTAVVAGLSRLLNII